MGTSQKCQYGLRAMFELALRWGEGPVRVTDIAEAQSIPPRFLENIVNQLRQGGFVESRRGKGGGVMLKRPPATVTVAEIVHFIDGDIYQVSCDGKVPVNPCKLGPNCVFLPVWRDARAALNAVYESRSLQDLVEAYKAKFELDYCI